MAFGNRSAVMGDTEEREAARNAPMIKDKMLVPLKNDFLKGSKELRDSTNAYMRRATTTPQWLIDEAIMDHFRKAGE